MSKKMRQVVGMCKKEQEVMLAQKKNRKEKELSRITRLFYELLALLYVEKGH